MGLELCERWRALSSPRAASCRWEQSYCFHTPPLIKLFLLLIRTKNSGRLELFPVWLLWGAAGPGAASLWEVMGASAAKMGLFCRTLCCKNLHHVKSVGSRLDNI